MSPLTNIHSLFRGLVVKSDFQVLLRFSGIVGISLLYLLNNKPLESALGDPKPNVVIFYTDDQGTLDAGCYGSDDLHTPNFDHIAANGVKFTQAYAHTV